MKGRRSATSSGTMLDLWRPPPNAGDPIGCLTTTYTFDPGLFDEQCLARFLEIESEPDREDLPFLLERESKLGGVYAGVLVDEAMAGVEHSLRWDVLPVRVRAGKQHAKLSLLVWSRHVRILVASANLSEPGYRSNFEVAAAVDATPNEMDSSSVADVLSFLRDLLSLVPGADARPKVVQRAESFLDSVLKHTSGWRGTRKRSPVHRHLVFTMPASRGRADSQSALESAITACRKRGGSPDSVRVASPFFDTDPDTNRVVAALCKMMARGGNRDLTFCVPALHDDGRSTPRLAAPKSLLTTPQSYGARVRVELLPSYDADKNRRPWHAKMLSFSNQEGYSALMIGSSNLTVAGLGTGGHGRNTEANLLTIVDRVAYGREVGSIEAVWPAMTALTDPESSEWLGARPEDDEESQGVVRIPEGFLSATFHAGEPMLIELRLDPGGLPTDWQIIACTHPARELIDSDTWRAEGSRETLDIAWPGPLPPDKLEIRWGEQSAFMPLNVEDSRTLPRPQKLDAMSADDMLGILAAADPSAAFRTWARQQRVQDAFDGDIDSATPIDLDPLRRYDLEETFLHRIRRRARIFAQLRANLQQPVWSAQALTWRLRGLIGVQPLAELYLRDFLSATSEIDHALLTLADLMLVLHEVEYGASEGMMPKAEFDGLYRMFLRELAANLQEKVATRRTLVSPDLERFWDQVVERCLS